MTGAPEVVVHPDADTLARAVADRLVRALVAAQAEHGSASVVLTGGGIGTAVLRAVAAGSGELDWARVDVWWGDERWVPAADDDRNEKGARAALLDVVGVPADRVHAFPSPDLCWVDGPDDAADAFLRDELLPAGGGALPRFDVLMLGVGPEGHVASIFPDSPGVTDERAVFAVHDCPKPPPTRLSLGFPAITSAEEVWLVASGEGKAEAVARALSGRETPASLPAVGAVGRTATRWLLDRDAAAEL